MSRHDVIDKATLKVGDHHSSFEQVNEFKLPKGYHRYTK